MRAILRSCLVAIALLAGLVGQTHAQDVVRIHGSNAIGEKIVPVLVRGWMEKIGYRGLAERARPNSLREISGSRDGESLMVEVDGKGSASGFNDLVEGNTELAMLSRPLTAKEEDAGWQLGRLHSPEQEYVVALQAMVVVVHPGNPLAAIDRATLTKIVSGRITDWSQLGGKPGAIHLQLAANGTGLAEMQAQLLATSPTTNAHRLASSAQIVRAVAVDPLAIGVIEFGAPASGVRGLAMKVVGRDVVPDRLNVMTEEYPLVRRLYFYSGQLITALGRGFVDYAVSDEGQRLLASHGFVAMVPAAYRAPVAGTLPKAYDDIVAGADRLSMSIHFSDEFSILDSRAMQDLPRLKAFMSRPENRQRKVVLVGLADKQAAPYMALSLSNERADLVAQALAEYGIYPVKVRGIGAVLPLADSVSDRRRNQRVEIWLR